MKSLTISREIVVALIMLTIFIPLLIMTIKNEKKYDLELEKTNVNVVEEPIEPIKEQPIEENIAVENDYQKVNHGKYRRSN